VSFVLVHGGGFAASCWDPLLPLLESDVRAVDLPGRGSRPGDLRSLDHRAFVEAVVDDITSANLSDVVLVGHSLAGITLPGVVGRMPDRLRRAVFVSCSVPPHDRRVLDTLPPEIQALSREADVDLDARPSVLDHDLARAIFCNDMDEDQARFTLDRMVPEVPGVIYERVDLSGLAQPVPRTYVKLLDDAILTPDIQDEMIANMGGAETVSVVSGHMAMISHPGALADVLNAF
jgi:pimeloyl-ACP methyl ester carboxylesterase